jgi:8-oxo-dGTP diphosphatase
MDKTSPVDIQRIATKALIIDDEGNYLLLREASTYEDGTNVGRYHLPGGRLEVGEYFENGLFREVKEETGLEVEIIQPIYVGEWRPVIKGKRNQIVAIFFLCKAKSKEVILSSEHDDFQWVNPLHGHQLDVMDPENKVVANYINSLLL